MEKFKRLGLTFSEMAIEKEEESYSVAKELIENLFFSMSKLSTKYSNDVFHDLPYTYSERRIDSILLPCLSKLCDSKVLVEVPTTRQCSNRIYQVVESNGRIDYWCIYKNYSFVIELKHSFDCFTTSNTRAEKVTSRWIKMNEQLQTVGKDIKDYEEKTKGVIRLGLHLVTSYSDKEPSRELMSSFKASVSETFERFSEDLGKKYPSLKPDVILCWHIPEKIVNGDYQTFPGLWAIGKIYAPIKHKGAIK